MAQIKGKYHDKLVDDLGRTQLDQGWRSNLIVPDCDRLIASLMKGYGGFSGITYLAVGEGVQQWDSLNPHPASTTAQLTHEILRLPLSSADILFFDSNNQPSAIPTSTLMITLELSGDAIAPDGPKPIREFGLFGGDATAEPDTGLMINHVIHPRIDLTSRLTLVRTLRLDFSSGLIIEHDVAGHFGANLPVTVIDGVAKRYSEVLNAAGINSLEALDGLDPTAPLGNIPIGKLREFCAKAKIIMRIRVNPAPLAGLSDYRLTELMVERPEVLAAAAGSERVTAGMIADLQEDLAVLAVAMDESQMKDITLREVVNCGQNGG